MLARRPAVLVTAFFLLAAIPRVTRAQPDPSGRWLTLETAHFRVHVRAETRALGLQAAADAEAAYAVLASELPPPGRTIEVIVGDNADYTNGAATEYPVPTALVYAVPPVGDIELGNYDRWLRVGLAHELTHVFELDLARGWWRLARGVFGRLPGLFPNLYAPDWMIEGLAVYYESRITGRGREDETYHGAIVGAQDAEGGALPIDAAVGAGPRWPDGYRPYAFGSRFFEWLTATWGDSAVPRLVRETAVRPIPYLWLSAALKPVAGVSLSQAWQRWQDSLVAAAPDGHRSGSDTSDAPPARFGTGTSAAAPDGHRSGSDTSDAPPARFGTGTSATAPDGAAKTRDGTVVLGGLREAVPPRISPDARQILFVDDRGIDAVRLAVLERGTGRVRDLARVNGAPGVSWGAGGGLVISQLDFTDPFTVRSDLWAVSAGGAERRLTTAARLRDPDVGPDGAIVATRMDAGTSELALTDSVTRALTPDEPGVEWAQPRFSPDGRAIAAVRQRGGWPQIVLLDRSGTVRRVVTDDSALCRTPAFSPDGAWLFWSGDRSGTAQLYATRVDGRAGRRWLVTHEPFGAYAPAPASDSVFYLAYHHDGFALAATAFDTAQWVPDSGASPAPRRAGPDAAPSTVETASPVIAEHPYRAFPSALPQYWLPVGQAGNGAGSFGVLTSGQDALGRHIYGAQLTFGTGLEAGRWSGSVGYVYARPVPWLVEASYSRSQLLVDTAPGGGTAPVCCREDENGSLSLVWLHSRWRTQVTASAGAEYERTGALRRAGPVLGLGAAHLVRPDFAISPQDGWTLAATVRERWRTDTALEYHEARLAATAYRALPFGSFAHAVLAVRGSAGIIGGSERVVYGVGGISQSSITLAPGLTLGGSQPTFPVRGHPADALLGRSAASLAVELRLPVALVGRGLGLLPVFLDRMSLALFADAGAAWFPRGFTALLPHYASIGSAGGELAVDLGALYGTALRFRLGAAMPLEAGAAPSAYVAFGPSF